LQIDLISRNMFLQLFQLFQTGSQTSQNSKMSHFQHKTCSLCSTVSKMWVYDIYLTQHPNFFGFEAVQLTHKICIKMQLFKITNISTIRKNIISSKCFQGSFGIKDRRNENKYLCLYLSKWFVYSFKMTE